MSSSSLTQLNTANGAIEGWRAVLSVVLRNGMGQRQRMSNARRYLERAEENVEPGSGSISASSAATEQERMDVDGIDSMMAGVKSRGVCVVFLQYYTFADISFARARNF
jgi:hypothetical protein